MVEFAGIKTGFLHNSFAERSEFLMSKQLSHDAFILVLLQHTQLVSELQQ
jgi:hypothetical protein